ncbi:ethylbenzene dehydrogenase-related protein [Desulfosporosinus nitroreducens]|uniref:Ethylbenzene dehydrogenase-related protein n=1 Tax=Desulfosporosinus nitroreducens TaxID=2018668 RepID=A0ABT8QPL1_9FIRM|nr:ethylbenzene dehydrogenase-related protein [Desulfosporosinus nitroreducens]MCO1600538.1 ethylbenzene dehydrogenase-related protein [Desulfosporosinus nitroreducens]MDO0822509.1 ethylbenzene dehydrogenase-related protein [Desulfosporosinus nitroreducens]
MKKHLVKIIGLMVLSMAVVTGCAGAGTKPDTTPTPAPAPVTDANTLTAVKTTAAPTVDGKSSEDFWTNAPEMKLTLSNAGALQGGTGGKFDNGNTEVSMKSAYDAENVYFLLQYKDPTDSKARGPWILEGGKLVKKPYNEFYEDKLAINWNINDSTKDFNTAGCAVTCHVATDKEGKSVTKHWTNAENELLDMWHWKYVRQNSLFGPDKPGLMHDQFMDSVKYDPNDATKSGAGRHADPGAKEYEDNVTADKSAPKLVFDGAPVNGNPYVIVDGLDKTKPFTADYIKTMKEGDFIPGPIAKQITGDPADIKAKGKWENGVWTLEISRKLKTTSDKDIQFDDLAKTYSFAIAAFDNSQIGHGYENIVHKLAFKQ